MKRYAIIENEEFALLNLKMMVEQLRPNYELVFTGESVEDSVRFFSGKPELDLVFMDIELTDDNCFEIFRRVEVRTPIIFTTAYNDFTLQAFKVNSVDYLLKPIAESDLENAIIKFEAVVAPRHPEIPDYTELIKSFASRFKQSRILISSGDNYSYTEIEDVAFFIRDEKYVCAVLRNGRSYITDFQNLSEVEQVVDPSRFFQVSRNIVANITAIGKVSKYFTGRLKVIVGIGEQSHEVVVSAARRTDFLNWLGGK